MDSLFRRALERRSAGVLLVGLLAVATLAVVFAGTLSESTTMEARVAQASATVSALEAHVEAGSEELRFVETDAFASQYARTLGYGERTEVVFSLRNGSPSPAPLVPLGTRVEASPPAAPFDAWMGLLFG